GPHRRVHHDAARRRRRRRLPRGLKGVAQAPVRGARTRAVRGRHHDGDARLRRRPRCGRRAVVGAGGRVQPARRLERRQRRGGDRRRRRRGGGRGAAAAARRGGARRGARGQGGAERAAVAHGQRGARRDKGAHRVSGRTAPARRPRSALGLVSGGRARRAARGSLPPRAPAPAAGGVARLEPFPGQLGAGSGGRTRAAPPRRAPRAAPHICERAAPCA
ncbi:MAG: hypothetical protein J3K34DRAFT_524476, partial [Monoraphidium minutum]